MHLVIRRLMRIDRDRLRDQLVRAFQVPPLGGRDAIVEQLHRLRGGGQEDESGEQQDETLHTLGV